MARTERIQFNIRSAFVRDRAHAIARTSGMTATQVVEEALRAYAPEREPVSDVELIREGRLVRRGPLLVLPANGRRITLERADAALNAARDERS